MIQIYSYRNFNSKEMQEQCAKQTTFERNKYIFFNYAVDLNAKHLYRDCYVDNL